MTTLCTNVIIKENVINRYLCYLIYQRNIFLNNSNEDEYYLFRMSNNTMFLNKDNSDVDKSERTSRKFGLTINPKDDFNVVNPLSSKLEKVTFRKRNSLSKFNIIYYKL